MAYLALLNVGLRLPYKMNAQTCTEVRVGLCADRGILPGLHATLLTALKHLPAHASLYAHILSDDLTAFDLDLLRESLSHAGRGFTIELHPADLTRLESAFPASGVAKHRQAWLTYGRFFLPSVIPTEKFIYLDSDLLVYADLSDLMRQPMNSAVGAVAWTTRRESHDADFFQAVGLPLDVPYFNAGVLLIDSAIWRENGFTNSALALANQYRASLPSADQTILNLLLGSSFDQLTRRFNTTVSAERRCLTDEEVSGRVIHLLGRPKPWDPFGILNGQSRHFEKAISGSSFPRRSKPFMEYVWFLRHHLNAVWKCRRLPESRK
jgi:lipopolysaccharide biosynthesis glycosyltransferase